MTARMVIVGGGECGARAAFALREAGWDGAVTIVGAESSPPYERPPLSKSMMTAPQEPAPATIGGPGSLGAAGIELLPGRVATDLDRDNNEAVLADGGRVGYQRLLIATGANARRLPPGGAAIDSVHYLRGLADARALRERLRPGARVAVIGGGFIGLELAASAAVRGCTVSVVESAPQLMGRVVPAEISTLIAARHEQEGIDLRTGTGVARIERRDEGMLLELTCGDTLVCDVVVAGIGAEPETALAEKTGLAVEDGVRVDARLATSDPNIFAAGDCCSFPHPLYDDRRIRLEAWRNAKDQGEAAARSMLGANEAFEAVPWFWSDQYDLTLQIAGLPRTAASEVVRQRGDGVEIRFGLGADGRLLAASAVGPGNTVAKDIRLAEMLIAHRMSPKANELADSATNLKKLLSQATATRTPAGR